MAEVPWLHAITCHGMKFASAPITMSETRCEISWFAYTTGAGNSALTTQPLGALISMVRQQPELGGMRLSGSMAVFSPQNTPDAVTESGAFIGPLMPLSVPEKSTSSRSPVFLTARRIQNGASL